MALTKQRYTFDELLALPDDGHFYELLEGELFRVTSPDLDHSDTVAACFAWLLRAESAGYGKVYTAPTAVLLDASVRRENAPEPDILFVSRDHLSILAGRYVEGVPDLVVEVLSPTTRGRDLPGGIKWRVYERFGVPFCWLADPETRTVACCTWRNGRYEEPALRRRGDALECPLFPGITLRVDDLFANVWQPEQPLPDPSPFRLRR